MQTSFAIHTHTNGRFILAYYDGTKLQTGEIDRNTKAALLRFYRQHKVTQSVIPSGFIGCIAIRYTVKF